jgi:hypothetical protein
MALIDLLPNRGRLKRCSHSQQPGTNKLTKMKKKNYKSGDLVRIVITEQQYEATLAGNTMNDCVFDGPKSKGCYWQHKAKFVRVLERPVAEFQVSGRVRQHPQIEILSAYALPPVNHFAKD